MAVTRPRHPRQFTLVDAMALIAALGVGLALARTYVRSREMLPYVVKSEDDIVRHLGPWTWSYAAVPALAMMTLALWPLRFVPPRPRFRRVVRLPGLMPSHVTAIASAVALARAAADLIHQRLTRTMIWGLDDANVLTFRMVELKDQIGTGVALAWLLMWLGGGWRPEASWIDRAGRVFGAVWIVFGVASWAAALFA